MLERTHVFFVSAVLLFVMCVCVCVGLKENDGCQSDDDEGAMAEAVRPLQTTAANCRQRIKGGKHGPMALKISMLAVSTPKPSTMCSFWRRGSKAVGGHRR